MLLRWEPERSCGQRISLKVSQKEPDVCGLGSQIDCCDPRINIDRPGAKGHIRSVVDKQPCGKSGGRCRYTRLANDNAVLSITKDCRAIRRSSAVGGHGRISGA